MESVQPSQQSSFDDIVEKYPFALEEKYKPGRLRDFQQLIKNPQHQTITVEKVRLVVNLINNQHVCFQLCPYTDTTVLYQVVFNPSGQREYFYTPLFEFLQVDIFAKPVILDLLKSLSDDSKVAFQLLLRFISPKRFADEVRKSISEYPLGLFHLRTSLMSKFGSMIDDNTFIENFRIFCEYFQFEPQQSTISVNGIKAKVLWKQWGFESNLHKVMYAFMMPAFLKFPEVLEATKTIAKYQETSVREISQLHQVIDFKIIGWGRCKSISDGEFYLQHGLDQAPTTHGETLLFVFKPVGGLPNSILLTKWLLATPHILKNGDMNVTTLNKEFFRRKLRCNANDTTGVLISEIQADFHILLNHMSFEDAHFQGYVMTAPYYNFSILAIESDNTTIGKVSKMFHEKLKKICQPSQEILQEEFASHHQTPRAMYYSIYTFRNFFYKDHLKESEMMDYIYNQGFKALTFQQEPYLSSKLASEWPHPGANHDEMEETEIQIANPNPIRNSDPNYDPTDPYWFDPLLQEADDPQLEPFKENEIPISFTKDNLMSELSQHLVEFSFRLIKHQFLNPHSIKLEHKKMNVKQKSV